VKIFDGQFILNFSWKELLPKLLHLLVSKPLIEHGGTQMSGEDFKTSVVTALCMLDWPRHILEDITAMFM